MTVEPPIRTTIAGAAGRMGRILIRLTDQDDQLTLAGALEQQGSEFLGRPVSDVADTESSVRITDKIEDKLESTEVLVDFTRPDATETFLKLARETHTRLVIGTTGLDNRQTELLKAVAQEVAVVKAPNMSVGINLLVKLVEEATRTLGNSFDAEVLEMHHRGKTDAPSGTAYLLAEAVAGTRRQSLEDVKTIGREGFTGERSEEEIGIASIRGGDVVGDHTVILAGEGERVELTHRASSRETFGNGAVRAVKFVAEQASGLYTMEEVLDL